MRPYQPAFFRAQAGKGPIDTDRQPITVHSRTRTKGISADVGWSGIRLNHYVLKSRRQFISEAAENSVDRNTRPWNQEYFAHNDGNDFLDHANIASADMTFAEMARTTMRPSPMSTRLEPIHQASLTDCTLDAILKFKRSYPTMRRSLVKTIHHQLLVTYGALAFRVLKAMEYTRVDRVRQGLTPPAAEVVVPLRPGRVAIIVIWAKIDPEPGLLVFLNALRARDVQIVAVANCPMPTSFRNDLRTLASVILDTDNTGRDFGAYQAGVRYVSTALPPADLSRLIFVNDSIHFFENADSSALVDALIDPGHPYVGAFENFEGRYHVGSFLFAVSGDVARSQAFTSFWAAYMPYSNRLHAIEHGELRLSRNLIATGLRPHIVYSAQTILAAMRGQLQPETLQINAPYFSTRARAVIADVIGSDDHITSSLASTARNRLIQFYEDSNQVHNLGLAAVVFCRCPFIKKDLVINEVNQLSDIGSVIKSLRLENGYDYRSTFQFKGMPSSRRNLRSRLRIAAGL